MARRIVSIPLVFNYVKFGSVIYMRRIDAGMMPDEIAYLVGMEKSTVYKYERGESNMKMQHFLAFCNVFDLDPREFFELEM